MRTRTKESHKKSKVKRPQHTINHTLQSLWGQQCYQQVPETATSSEWLCNLCDGAWTSCWRGASSLSLSWWIWALEFCWLLCSFRNLCSRLLLCSIMTLKLMKTFIMFLWWNVSRCRMMCVQNIFRAHWKSHLKRRANKHDLWYHKWYESQFCSDIQQTWVRNLEPPVHKHWRIFSCFFSGKTTL